MILRYNNLPGLVDVGFQFQWSDASRVIPMPPFPILSFSRFMSRAIYHNTFFKNSVQGYIVVLKSWAMGKLHGKKDQYRKGAGLEAWQEHGTPGRTYKGAGARSNPFQLIDRIMHHIQCVSYLHLFTRPDNPFSLSITSSALIFLHCTQTKLV